MVSINGTKQVINLFIHNPGQQLAKKPGTIKMLVEDIGNLRYKPLTSKKVKPLSYKEKQNADILLYGEMKTERIGVSTEELDEITPFRRLSKKLATLSDPEYFINQYQDVMKEYMGRIDDFERLLQTEKIDRIVKYRYARLVANKIMNRIQKMPIESHYSIGENGSIMAKDIGNATEVELKNAMEVRKKAFGNFDCDIGYMDGGELPVVSVHNHPMDSIYPKWESIPEYIREKLSKLGFTKKSLKAPFSPRDIKNYCKDGENGYVVDMNGHKYSFVPNQSKGFERTLRNNEDFILELEEIEKECTEASMKHYDLANKYREYQVKNDSLSEQIFLESYIDYLVDKHYFDLLKKAEEKCGKFLELNI